MVNDQLSIVNRKTHWQFSAVWENRVMIVARKLSALYLAGAARIFA